MKTAVYSSSPAVGNAGPPAWYLASQGAKRWPPHLRPTCARVARPSRGKWGGSQNGPRPGSRTINALGPASTGSMTVTQTAAGRRVGVRMVDVSMLPVTPAVDAGFGLDAELRQLRTLVSDLRVETRRLVRLLNLAPGDTVGPGAVQTAFFDRPPEQVDARSPAGVKVAFFRALFGARTDVYAVRWSNVRSGKSGWMPAVQGRWRKGETPDRRQYLPLTDDVITSHLSGAIDIGLYPMLDGDNSCWLAADFDGPAAMLDALAYLKAARAAGASAALEVSRSGRGAHVWMFSRHPFRLLRPGRSAPVCCVRRSPFAGGWI